MIQFILYRLTLKVQQLTVIEGVKSKILNFFVCN